MILERKRKRESERLRERRIQGKEKRDKHRKR